MNRDELYPIRDERSEEYSAEKGVCAEGHPMNGYGRCLEMDEDRCDESSKN